MCHILEVPFECRQEPDVVFGLGVEFGQILFEELEGIVNVVVDVEKGLHFGHLLVEIIFYDKNSVLNK